ncbi:radical SAM/B12 binding domain protein [Minicystis rosea]|nr:radical SAM/B12 binding domain protein [Minicystis rosea]
MKDRDRLDRPDRPEVEGNADVPPLGIEPGDALLIVPPWANLLMPSLGVHVLQASAREAGLAVRVLYANIALASVIGESAYVELACGYNTTPELIGERFFARAAFDKPPLGLPPDGSGDDAFVASIHTYGLCRPLSEVRAWEERLTQWVEPMAEAIAALGFPIVGASTTFEQTASSIALLRAIKRKRPETITMLGGANCEGPMAEGILSTGADIDYVFSGESETSFVEHVRAIRAGARPADRLVKNPIRSDMDALPRPDYQEFFAQRKAFLPSSAHPPEDAWLLYESSRGCWWGEKQHCTFCGLNGLGMRFREKSADKVIGDLRALVAAHPTKKIWLTDNIMPQSYFRTVLPRLAAEAPGLELFYEEKANLSLDKVLSLRDAGVVEIQPGIEALSTPLLDRMNKGVSAAQNIALLRYIRAAGMMVAWNIIYGFPGDAASDYEETLALLPLIRHLHPPQTLGRLRIDRFAPYHERAAEHGIRDVAPFASYGAVFPEGADLDHLAFYFTGEYASGLDDRDDLITGMSDAVEAWRAAWKAPPKDIPVLSVTRAREGLYILVDTRGLPGAPQVGFLDESKAAAVLTGSRAAAGAPTADMQWALARRYAVTLDNRHVPLAVAEPALLRHFEAQAKSRRLPLLDTGT